MLGHEDWEAAARTFAGWGPGLVVVKLGAEGCLVHDRPGGRTFRVPAHPAAVVDTTGAGDSFCGGFLAARLGMGLDVEAAARAGAVAASFAVEGRGAEPMFGATAAEARRRLEG